MSGIISYKDIVIAMQHSSEMMNEASLGRVYQLTKGKSFAVLTPWLEIGKKPENVTKEDWKKMNENSVKIFERILRSWNLGFNHLDGWRVKYETDADGNRTELKRTWVERNRSVMHVSNLVDDLRIERWLTQ